MARPQARMHVAYAVLLAGIVSALPVGCSDETLPIREVPPRGTVGQELFSILCNRMGAQALREDLTGASFAAACTRDSSGRYAKEVDRSRLPPLETSARNEDGDIVPLDVQQKTRDHGIARLSALIRRRDAFIQAVDQIIPDVLVPSKNIESEDPQRSCEARRDNSGRRSLSEELRVMLGKTASLYDEGTLPRVTRSTAKLLDTFKASPDAQKSLEQFNARQGYRPSLQSLGLFRSLATYPRLRELADATLSAVSPDSNPYDLRPEFDELGNRKWTPGKAHAEFGRLLTVLHQEMRTARVGEGMPSLTTKSNPNLALESLSRPRTNLELLQHLMFFENEAFQAGSPQFLVRRDPRGVAAINLGGGALPSPLQDSNKDGLADLDDSGQFLLDRGAQLLTPFTTKGALRGPGRDSFDRALRSDGSTTFYNYLDTRRTFMARALQELRSMVDSNPAHRHETLMYLLAGGKVVLGNRVPASKCFGLARDINGPCGAAPKSDEVEIRYDAFDPNTSPLIDLVHATAQIMGDPNADDGLNLLQNLLENNTSDVARLVGEGLKFKALADEDSRATLKPGNILWDELLEWASELVEVPGLLEDTLSAIASDDSSNFGKRLASMMRNRDAISYTRGNINGGPYNLSTKRGSFSAQGLEVSVDRNAPASSTNRSVFQRFLGLVNDASGVTLCNKQGSVLHARGVPLPAIANNLCPQNTNMDVPGTFRCVIIQKETHPGRTSLNECEVFKVDDMASFYIGAMSGRYDRGKGQLYLRDKVARDGITVLGITAGAATVDVMEKSSGFDGFWAPGKTADADGIFYPQPRWLNRMVSFDQATDNSAPTKAFLADLVGPHIGSAVCKEREIRDPLDGTTVRRLRSCADGEYLDQRSKDTFLAMEVPMTHSLNGKTSTTTVYEDLRPLLMPFVVRNREDLFVKLTKILHKHWANDDATASECKLSPTTSCARTGGVLYEPLLDQFLGGEPMAAGYSLLQKLRTIKVQHCAAVDAVGQCTKTVELPALQVVANLLRPLLSKAGAETNGIATRNGETRARWSDGSLQGRVTPLRLLLDALTSFDRSFEAYAVKEPADKGRLEQWRLARSQLVDQFLTVDTAGGVSQFHNPVVVPMGQRLLGTLRSQLRARCPNTYWGTTSDKRSPCLWVTSEWKSKVETLLANPILSAGIDLLEQLRRDDGARIELERLVEYLSGTSDEDDTSAALLVSGSDMLQLLGDETRLVPFLRSISEVTAGTTAGTASGGPATSAIDSLLSLLSRVSKRAYDAEGREQCHREIDPNQTLVRLLRNAFTSSGDDNSATETPIEVLADTLAEVNRAVPADTGRLKAFDYASIADNMAEFLLDDERGLEQLYAIMRQGTALH